MNNSYQQKLNGSLSLANQILTGKISNQLTVEGELVLKNQSISSQLSSIENITGEVNNITNSISGEITSFLNNTITGNLSLATSEYPNYNGEIQIIPNADTDILLNTKDKVIKENIVINKIPYTETSNLSGGYTVIIG